MAQSFTESSSPTIQLPYRGDRPLSGIEPANALRTGHLNLDTFSPVNENGSFEFDRVLKRGMVYCRIKSKHVRPLFLLPLSLCSVLQ
jgi:hypothetical protein